MVKRVMPIVGYDIGKPGGDKTVFFVQFGEETVIDPWPKNVDCVYYPLHVKPHDYIDGEYEDLDKKDPAS